mmetsp:Transcript_10468/g.18463  ORF Transcript_10468/g.18463 Transcript_10468/m.18463 type:complete len:532 (-) Transcript_10468:44-1639(-)
MSSAGPASLLYAVSQHDHETVKKLLSSGVDVNAADYDKRTAAHIAASEGNLDTLKLLQDAGANLGAKDRWSGTPLDDALMEGKKDCALFLEKNGVKRGKRRLFTNEETAADEDDSRDIDISSSLAAFLQAAAQGDVSRVEKLLAKNGVNAADYDSRTALHVAASDGNTAVVKFLVERDALINTRDRWGHTPLDDAIRGKFPSVIEFLREHGGETTGAYEDSTDTKVPEGEMRKLQARGEKEKWAISNTELVQEDKPFARGAGGELYRAKWRGLRVVAKSCANMISNAQALVDLGNEISLLSTMRHPNLIMFLGACFDTFPPLLLMEYAQGGTLEERIIQYAGEGKALPRREKMKFTYELALGMNFLHLCNPGVVHRDLKPSNILLTGDLNVRVTDFGLSKFLPQKNLKLGDKFKMTGETGSYRFMATEVFLHESYNEKVDVYSFALIVYWMQTGSKPFVNIQDPVEAVKAAALHGVRPNTTSLAPPMKKLLEDAWHQEPDHRPSFAEIIERLDKMGYDTSGPKTKKTCNIS